MQTEPDKGNFSGFFCRQKNTRHASQRCAPVGFLETHAPCLSTMHTLARFLFPPDTKIHVNIKSDISAAIAKIGRIREDVSTKATFRALNKVAAQAKTQASREIRDAGYNIKAAAIKKTIEIRKATYSELRAVVKATGRPITLMEYSARQTRAGVTVTVKNGRKLLKSAFVATMPNGHTGVFERVGSGHKKTIKNGRVVWSGLPIKELFGPAIPSMFKNQVVTDALLAMVKEKFPAIFKHEVEFLSLKK